MHLYAPLLQIERTAYSQMSTDVQALEQQQEEDSNRAEQAKVEARARYQEALALPLSLQDPPVTPRK